MAEQTYQDRWATASFRGFEFRTDSHDAKYGRRLVVHEYPGAEDPLVEDMGGKAREYQLTAYFTGPQYDLECNGLLAKLNESGPAWLTHPWLGQLWVRAQQWSRTESSDKNGYCTLSISFVPGGEQPFGVEPDKVDVAVDRTHVLGDAAEDDFNPEEMNDDGMTAFIAAVQRQLEVVRTVIALASLPLTYAQQIMGVITGIKGDIGTLMGMPGAYANALRGLMNSFGASADDVDVADTDRPRVVSRLCTLATTNSAVTAGLTDGAVRRNLQQQSALQSRLLVMAAAQVALTDYRSEADRDAALASVDAAFEALLPSLPDAVFQAAVDARAALREALLAQELNPAVVRDVINPLPATLLAHLLEVDEAVLLARNAVRHPLFMQGRVNG